MSVGSVGPVTVFEIRPVRKVAIVSRGSTTAVDDETIEATSREPKRREHGRPRTQIVATGTAEATTSPAVLAALIDLPLG